VNISVKGIQLQTWASLQCSMSLRLPDFLDGRHMKVVRLSDLRTGRLYPQDIFLILISVSDPRAIMRLVGLTL